MKTPTKTAPKPRRSTTPQDRLIRSETAQQRAAQKSAGKSAGKSAPPRKVAVTVKGADAKSVMRTPKKAAAKVNGASAPTKAKKLEIVYLCPRKKLDADAAYTIPFGKRAGTIVRRTREAAVIDFTCADPECKARHTYALPFNATARS